MIDIWPDNSWNLLGGKKNWKSELPRALKAIALAVNIIFFVSCCYIIKNGVPLIAVINSFLLALHNYLY